MTRIIALILSFSIIFTSVAPLYAQGADAVVEERIAVANFEKSYRAAVSAEAKSKGQKAKTYETSLKAARLEEA
ncbi:MAG: hypothetical protein IJ311_03895, partial [Elusimicrobiaceae bacterium]|nr:hypothetical protein [Elusimicrobiaceae bacterium]